MTQGVVTGGLMWMRKLRPRARCAYALRSSRAERLAAIGAQGEAMVIESGDVAHRSTALLVVDPFNDFLSEGGKLWPRAKETLEKLSVVEHLTVLAAAARETGIGVFFVPHHRLKPGDYEGWRSLTTAQERSKSVRFFEAGTWGGEFHPNLQPQVGDIVAHEHWSSSGFAHTDLDFLLKMHGIGRVVVVGLRANTCMEATARHAVELGYHTTIVRDATAAFSWEEMRAAFDINGPTYAQAIVATEELLDAWRGPRIGLEVAD